MISGLESMFSQLRNFFPPDLSPVYLKAALVPLFETLEIAAAATFLALIIGLLVSLYIGARLPGARRVYALLARVRALHELALAIFCVIVLGLGTAAGVAALTIFYSAAMGKIFADLFASADPGPVEALRSTGAGRVVVTFFGLLPLRLNDLLTYGAYEFESVIRAATIIGAVGAGGLGTELIGSVNMADYRRVTTPVIMLGMVVAGVDRVAGVVRRSPKLLVVFANCGVAAVWVNRPEMLALRHSIERFRSMLPPKAPEHLGVVPGLVGEALLMPFAGTLLPIFFPMPLDLPAARNLSPSSITFPFPP